MNILVTGARGQLGKEFKYLEKNNTKHFFFFTTKAELNILDKEAIEQYIIAKKIDGIINCGAYTAVDNAEEDKELALAINATAVKNLVELIEKYKIKLIHFSTDYVFNGKACIPYKIDDLIDPVNYYGITKRKGEEFILNSDAEAILIRTSWVYSTYGKNFVKTILKLAQNKEKLTVIDDQIGSPTYARDLAEVVLQIINSTDKIDSKGKIYHYSNEGVCSWYDFATAIVDIKNISCDILPVDSSAYKTLANRPHFSVMDKKNIKNDFSIEIPYWRYSLEKCLKEI